MELCGIMIVEWRLLVVNILFTVLFLVCMAVYLVDLLAFRDPESKKKKQRLQQLKAKPNKGPSTYKKIQKLQRQLKKDKDDRGSEWFFDALCILLMALALRFGVVPGWVDYAKKDYVVYEGTFTCEFRQRTMYVILEDGTALHGGLSIPEGTYDGKVVYAKRMKITLGGQGDDSMIFEDWRRKYEGNLWNDA